MNNAVDLTLTGEAVNNYFGISVSDAGDVNGDGYSDVIVGAYGYTTNTGRAYIYLGASVMDNTADVIMTGEGTNSYFGNSVSSAGDVNGDGYSDVIVGAYGYAVGGSANFGKTYVYFGGVSMNNVADFTITGEALGDRLGFSVSSAGDVNRDGYSDVITGAYGYSSNTGKAYVYFGGIIIDNGPDMIITGNNANDYFAGSVSDAGDVNGDGYSDFIVGAYGNSSNTGKAYVYYGGLYYDYFPDFALSGESANDMFGASVSAAGDVNGDGYSDLISGAKGNNSGTGKSYVYLGSAISANPILISVKDLPNDQGGKVILKWARSIYDVYNNSIIKDYVIQRSYPPLGGNFSWENIAVISATYEPFYTYTADTPYDSSSNNNSAFYFRITARTYIAQQFWRSAILSGRSLDNIPPLAVSPFTASQSANNVQLNWKRSTAPDLMNYILYRNTSPVINPDTEPVFATTADSSLLDTSPLSGLYYYFIAAQDIHNNKSPVSIAESPNMTLNLTMFIEGFYNAGSDSQVSDTITVELRNSASPFAVADQTSAFVSANGTVQVKFGNAANGNYYIAVKHRNSIETWSSGAIVLSRTTPASFDLSSSLSQAFGNNLKQADTSPVRFAIFSGDVNQDGTVDAADVSEVENAATNSVSGYVPTDVTGDNYVDAGDLSIVENNASLGVSAVTP